MHSLFRDANPDRLRNVRTSRRQLMTGAAATAAGAAIVPFGMSAQQATPAASPAAPRYQAVQDFMDTIVAIGQAPGAVWLIDHRGEVEVGTVGTMDFESGEPMRRDAVFRIASVTKPIVAVAALTLVERGEIGLDDPVDPWLPELADRRVIRTLESPLDDTVPAERPITLRDILSFKMGLGFFFDPPGTYPIQEAFAEAGIASMQQFPPDIPPADEFMTTLGELPLASQPGEVWRYNTPMDVAGVLIARVTGGSLEGYLQDIIFSPLGMVDTGFHVPDADIDRLTTLYNPSPATGELEVSDPAEGGEWSEPPDFASGAAGLVSTADDLLAFGRMMLNGSRHDSGYLLSDALFAEMTTNNLTPTQKAAGTFFPGFWSTWGWGLGLGVVTLEGGIPSGGTVGWLGGTSTALIIDPVEEAVAVLLFQIEDPMWFGPVFSSFLANLYPALAG